MKKIKLLSFITLCFFCFSILFFKPTTLKTYCSAQNSNTEVIDVTILPHDIVITDTSKKYVLTGTTTDKTITFRNDTQSEKTFYVTINHLYMSIENYDIPVIEIQDRGYKTTVNLNIQGSNQLTGISWGAIFLSKYQAANIDDPNNAQITINFSTKNHGTIELNSGKDNLKSPTIFVKKNVDETINLSDHNTVLTAFSVNSTTFDTFEEGIAEAIKDSSKTFCKIRMEKAEDAKNKIEFNMMGHGEQIEPIFLDESQAKFTPQNVDNVDGLIFYGWYKDITLNHKWNPDTDTVTDDMILYAGWFVPGHNETPNELNFPVWAVVLISTLSFIVLLGNAYVIIYFCFYKKGKFHNKFFNLIYNPLDNKKNEKFNDAKNTNNQSTNKRKKTQLNSKTLNKKSR